jgi:hypothetical protein
MKKIILLIAMVTTSAICDAKEPCLNKTFETNSWLRINAKSYQFIDYLCDDESAEKGANLKKGMLEVHAKNFNKSFKNVTGIWGMKNIQFAAWNNKPTLYYSMSSSVPTEGYFPITIKNNDLIINCSYISKFFQNGREAKYSYCGDKHIIKDGFGEDEIEYSFPDFHLYSVFYDIYFPKTNTFLVDKEFDVFIGKIDDINFYRRYASYDNYLHDNYTVIMANKKKEYHFKTSQIYQRMAKARSKGFIGLDIIDSKGNITFYGKKALLALLNKSTIKPSIKSYIQQEKAELYDSPNGRFTDMYLVQNDLVNILDVSWNKESSSNVWFKVSYNSKKHGEIIKWIRGYAFNPWNYGEG